MTSRGAEEMKNDTIGVDVSGIGSTEAEIAQPTARYTSSPSDVYEPTTGPRTTLLDGSQKAIPNSTPFEH